MTVTDPHTGRLAALSERVRADLHMLRYPDQPWLTAKVGPGGVHVYDVAIVGGGQGGLAIAARLRRERVDNIVVYDRERSGFEGPWRHTARMPTLRTLKHLPGIDATLPNLSPQAWYMARYGEEAWKELVRIPRDDWQKYLIWCREVLDLPVRNHVQVDAITPEGDLFRIDLSSLHTGTDRPANETAYARRIVMATGVDGGGAWHVPDFISDALPRDRYASSGEPIDFSTLKHKRIAVLGAGASAFDNASTALEAGAKSAVVCIRRKDIQRINPQMWMAKAGFLNHYADLPDAMKWRFMRHMFRYNIPAPQSAYERLSAMPGAAVRTNAAWTSVRLADREEGGEEIEITTATGEVIEADFLILAIGFVQDLRLRPELAGLADGIARWSDRFVPPEGEMDASIGAHPYLGPSFEFQERAPGTSPHVTRIFNFTYGALMSMGLSGAAISGFKYALPRLVQGITRSLFIEDAAAICSQFEGYAEPEMLGQIPFANDTVGDRNQTISAKAADMDMPTGPDQ